MIVTPTTPPLGERSHHTAVRSSVATLVSACRSLADTPLSASVKVRATGGREGRGTGEGEDVKSPQLPAKDRMGATAAAMAGTAVHTSRDRVMVVSGVLTQVATPGTPRKAATVSCGAPLGGPHVAM